MTIIFKESDWWYNKTVVDYDGHRELKHKTTFGTSYAFNYHITIPFNDYCAFASFNDGDNESFMHISFIVCHEVDSLFITHIKGVRINNFYPFEWYYFDEENIEDDNRTDVLEYFKLLFADIVTGVQFFDTIGFNDKIKLFSNTIKKQVDVLPLCSDIKEKIMEYMKPSWFHYNPQQDLILFKYPLDGVLN